MKFRSALVVYSAPESSQERKARDIVLKMLKESGIPTEVIERKKLLPRHYSKKSVVIPVGGDGTFLATARYATATPLLGVNADTKRKEGFLLNSTEKSFRKDLGKIIKGEFQIKHLPVLEARVNGKLIPTKALNEFYLGAEKAYVTSRYHITLKGKKEEHRSSGLIVCTPQGVNAWANSVYGRKLVVPKNRFAYVIREPYENSIFSNYSIKKGILRKNERITFTSKMSSIILVPDSLEEIRLKRNDKVVIQKSRKTVKVICT